MRNLFSCNNGGIQIFLLFQNIFNVGKQNFIPVMRSNSFLDKKCDNSLQVFWLECLTLIGEIQTDEEQTSCFYFGDKNCMHGFSHELVL